MEGINKKEKKLVAYIPFVVPSEVSVRMLIRNNYWRSDFVEGMNMLKRGKSSWKTEMRMMSKGRSNFKYKCEHQIESVVEFNLQIGSLLVGQRFEGEIRHACDQCGPIAALLAVAAREEGEKIAVNLKVSIKKLNRTI